ncbi:MAG: hypothetical protein FD167_2831, partial [bacterium]
RTTNSTPLLTWQSTRDFEFNNYTIELSTSSAFSFINLTFKSGGNISNNSFRIATALDPGHNWTWRVVAYDKSNLSRISTNALRYELYSNSVPTMPNNTAPANNSIILYNRFNFTWTASTDVDSDNITYEFLVARDTAFTDIDLNRTSIKTIWL